MHFAWTNYSSLGPLFNFLLTCVRRKSVKEIDLVTFQTELEIEKRDSFIFITFLKTLKTFKSSYPNWRLRRIEIQYLKNLVAVQIKIVL